MRRALIPWVLLGLAVVAIAVPMAQGTSSAKDPRVAGLVKRVGALEKKVNGLIVKTNCIGIQGIVLRGTVTNEGYLYKKASDDTNLYLYTAIDAPDTGEAPQQLMAVINPSCVTPARTLYRTNGKLVGKQAVRH